MGQRLCQDNEYNIGSNLKLLRNRANLTQAQVAARLQVMGLPVSREVYAQIETGKHHIKLKVLYALKQIYKASYEEIFDGIAEKKK